MIDEQTVENIKSTVDIVDVISDYVKLKKHGSGWLGLCPFHEDKHPSLNVSRSKGIYKCFACGAGGDAIKFLMDLEQISYYEALCYLAEEYNIEVDESNKVSKSKNRLKLNQPIFTQTPVPTYMDSPEFIEKHGDIFNGSLKGYGHNHLVTFLTGVFGVKVVNQMIAEYNIGSSKKWNGATVFWQVDKRNNVHSGKIMQYNPKNGKRVKKPYDHVNWVHSVMSLPDFNLQQCLFGEHLLKKYPDRTVAIVESEKTAIIASVVFGDYVTLACGGCGNLIAERCRALNGRDVILFPDNGMYHDSVDKDGKLIHGWETMGKKIRNIFGRLRISDIMERMEQNQGDDIGDLFLEHYPHIDYLNSLDYGLHEL